MKKFVCLTMDPIISAFLADVVKKYPHFDERVTGDWVNHGVFLESADLEVPVIHHQGGFCYDIREGVVREVSILPNGFEQGKTQVAMKHPETYGYTVTKNGHCTCTVTTDALGYPSQVAYYPIHPTAVYDNRLTTVDVSLDCDFDLPLMISFAYHDQTGIKYTGFRTFGYESTETELIIKELYEPGGECHLMTIPLTPMSFTEE